VMGEEAHPDVTQFVSAKIIERWQKMGVRFVDLSLRKPMPSRRGEPLTRIFRVAMAVSHAIRRGERYDRHEVEEPEIFS
jgi:hypothetical protein